MYGLSTPMETICAWHASAVFSSSKMRRLPSAVRQTTIRWDQVRDAAVFSFGLGKIIDQQVGGALVTDDEKLAAEISRILVDLPLWNDALLDQTNQ
jgi:hypothetical protein